MVVLQYAFFLAAVDVAVAVAYIVSSVSHEGFPRPYINLNKVEVTIAVLYAMIQVIEEECLNLADWDRSLKNLAQIVTNSSKDCSALTICNKQLQVKMCY